MKFGDNLKLIRKQHNMSQEILADKIGVTRQSVSKWETGEAYPEMSNILALCKIFNCTINDLVNEEMIDINSLDEEIKMSVVKLKEDKQKKMKGLSKTISVIAKVGDMACRIGAGALICAMAVLTFLGIFIKTNESYIDIFGQKINYVVEDKQITLTYKDQKEVVKDKDDYEVIKYVIDNMDKKALVIVEMDVVFILLAATLVLVSISLNHLNKLFDNIHDGNTPFTLENVEHIKKIAYFMIAVAIVSMIGEAFTGLFVENALSLDVDGIDIINILFLFSMSYIFEYGYEIQADSKGVMYDEK